MKKNNKNKTFLREESVIGHAEKEISLWHVLGNDLARKFVQKHFQGVLLGTEKKINQSYIFLDFQTWLKHLGMYKKIPIVYLFTPFAVLKL